ncbi:hypothetical protein BBF96_09970 [Anoxybacter fermentans]|uniref:Metallo-beta-lactamase domain-containing protein n=1 Tax=Anoxybacter fermentans TaxID=1323375 RepID=A0A3S9SZA3_9FIRM|nr:MBL fold metallo-hydrolase [Anoxybacter fermentans]AZR73683.1 hypothetical protein BBF96_09970 [Anoxybacter fermentans]
MFKWSKRIMLLIVTIILVAQLVFPVLAEDKPTLEVHFIDVGQGDCILLHSSNGVDILIDGGYPDNGRKILIYIRRLGIKELDLVIGTHPHADHIGGLIDVLNGIKVKRVIDPGVVYPSGIYESYLTTIKNKKILFTTVLAGDIIEMKEDPFLKLKVLAPYEDQLDYGDDVNDVSIVIKAVFGNVSFLLTGDAGFDTEDRMIWNKVDLQSTILKVGHHGSKSSTGDMFLTCVSPEVAVIQVGANNNYGHPTDEVLERLNWKDIKIYRNDLHGTIVVTTDGETYKVETEKQLEAEQDIRVNINKAPLGDLLDIPGMSYELAREIVDYRENFGIFLNKNELLKLDSITPELLEQILPYIKFSN